MNELTDFLLARIAEDEAVAHDVLADRHRLIESGARIENPSTVALEMYDDGPSAFAAMSAERLLAECAAKRAIVTAYEQSLDRPEAGMIVRSAHPHATDALEGAVRALAGIYAGRGNFDAGSREGSGFSDITRTLGDDDPHRADIIVRDMAGREWRVAPPEEA